MKIIELRASESNKREGRQRSRELGSRYQPYIVKEEDQVLVFCGTTIVFNCQLTTI